MNKEAMSAALLKTMPSGWAARYQQAGQAASAKRGLTWAGGGTARAALPSRSATQATAPAPAPAAPPAPVATPATAPVAAPAAMPGTLAPMATSKPAPVPVAASPYVSPSGKIGLPAPPPMPEPVAAGANPSLSRMTGGWKPALPQHASAGVRARQPGYNKAASLLEGFMDELSKTAGTALTGPFPRPDPKYRSTRVHGMLRRLGKLLSLRGGEDRLLRILHKAVRKPSQVPAERFRHAHRLQLLSERARKAAGLRQLAALMGVIVGVPTGVSVAASHLRRKDQKKKK